MLNEVLEYFRPRTGQNFLDCTAGGGGHALALEKRVRPDGQVLAIDRDPKAIARLKRKTVGKNLILVNDNYKNLLKIADDCGIDKFFGVLLDLGLSSDQLVQGNRGFSFQGSEFLDLRYNPEKQELTGADILKSYSQEQLIEILEKYGEEPLARPIAKKIIAIRRQGQSIETADMLVQLVSTIYRRRFKKKSRRHPATRVFQALRLAVNDELNNLAAALPGALEILEPGGRLAVISFHSGEDRLVKNFFRQQAKFEPPNLKILTKKPLQPSLEERASNSASRSAKLRVAEKSA